MAKYSNASKLDDKLRSKLNEDDKNISAKAKRRRVTVGVMISVLLFSLIASSYYLIESAIVENSYKIHVGGTNSAYGLRLSYDKSFGNGYYDITGKGLRIEDNTNRGLSFGTSTISNVSSSRNYDVYSYLMSVGSSKENTVNTNVSDKGQVGGANGDQFLTSKFYLKNIKEKDELNGKDNTVYYSIRLTIDKNSKNALSAARFALIEVDDEENIYDYETGISNNSTYKVKVIAQPKIIKKDNGDSIVYKGDEEDSQEYVGTKVTGQYTTDENAVLVKNPNKNHEDEDWLCTNLHKGDDGIWTYDSLTNETEESEQVFSLKAQEQRAYVVASWYEASDPDHGEAIKSGYISFTFEFYEVIK